MSNSRQVYHQDYIARIRYSNALPPPPFLPKFLDIPNAGLSSGQYTSAAFASRLAREQPLNIEADAELGMPIDLVGIRGVFNGDESAIQFEDDPPSLHFKDRELLRPLNQLGKPMSITSGVSFLRRTEYITSTAPVNRHDARNPLLRPSTQPRRKRRPDVAKDDPIHIIRSVVKGFDIAYPRDAYTGPDNERNVRSSEISQEEKEAWARPRHPTNPNLTVLDSYPILPDLEAFPDTGNYMVLKYQNNPSTSKEYDTRLDVALIRPKEQTAEEQAAFAEKLANASTDPSRPKPIPEFRYEVFLPDNAHSVTGIKRKFSTVDPENDDESLYDFDNPDTGRRCFRYKRLRAYETYSQSGNPDDTWNDSVAMILHDPETDVGYVPGTKSRLQKAAYLYPVVQKTNLRAVRPKTVGMLMANSQARVEEETDKIDFLEVAIREPTESELEKMNAIVEKIDPDGAVRDGE